jgi:hypothetical protein
MLRSLRQGLSTRVAAPCRTRICDARPVVHETLAFADLPAALRSLPARSVYARSCASRGASVPRCPSAACALRFTRPALNVTATIWRADALTRNGTAGPCAHAEPAASRPRRDQNRKRRPSCTLRGKFNCATGRMPKSAACGLPDGGSPRRGVLNALNASPRNSI